MFVQSSSIEVQNKSKKLSKINIEAIKAIYQLELIIKTRKKAINISMSFMANFLITL